MDSFPAPALELVDAMREAAAAAPARAVAFQGAPGANSHRARGGRRGGFAHRVDQFESGGREAVHGGWRVTARQAADK